MTFRFAPDAPAALAVVAAHDRHEPVRPALAPVDRHPLGQLHAAPCRRGTTTSTISRSSSAWVLRGVDLVEALVELLHGQPALAGGAAEDLRVALAVGVGRAQRGERVVGHSPQRTVRAMGRITLHQGDITQRRGSRRDRQRRQLVPARRRRRGRGDPPRGRAGAARGVPHAGRLQDRRREAHGRGQAAGAARDPRGRAGLARRLERRAGAAGLLLPAGDRTGRRGRRRAGRVPGDLDRRLRLPARGGRARSRCAPRARRWTRTRRSTRRASGSSTTTRTARSRPRFERRGERPADAGGSRRATSASPTRGRRRCTWWRRWTACRRCAGC